MQKDLPLVYKHVGGKPPGLVSPPRGVRERTVYSTAAGGCRLDAVLLQLKHVVDEDADLPEKYKS